MVPFDVELFVDASSAEEPTVAGKLDVVPSLVELSKHIVAVDSCVDSILDLLSEDFVVERNSQASKVPMDFVMKLHRCKTVAVVLCLKQTLRLLKRPCRSFIAQNLPILGDKTP